MTFTNKGIGY